MSDVIKSSPRARPPLSPELKGIYVNEYKDDLEGRSVIQQLSQLLESWMHRKVSTGTAAGAILEISAGTLKHLQYEHTDAYDVVEPFSKLKKIARK